ncbi:MAG: hypothetical protein K6T65_07010 [Peptococcaceae bacterium]|nr:hypothetical protein [Peptococcaceae bacterium]
MLINLLATTLKKFSDELKEASPEEKERLMNSAINLLEVMIDTAKNKRPL